MVVAPDAYDVLMEQQAVLCSLAKLDPDRLTIEQSMEPPSQAATIVVGQTTCYLPLAEIVDLEEERQRLSEELADVEGRIAHSKDLLAGQFAERAPEHVVQRERDKLKDLKTERAELEHRLKTLS
jgi:valyl-tRNA synthetase